MIETKEWTVLDRSGWREPGLAEGEPDKAQWPDPETGMACLAVRHSAFGHWCGYVGVPRGHPLFGVGYDEAQSVPRPGGDEDDRDYPDALTLSVHGGVTFADACEPSTRGDGFGVCHVAPPGEEVWWFGFDCAHCDDISPGMRAMPMLGYRRQYRTLAYVREQCANLARQLHARGRMP